MKTILFSILLLFSINGFAYKWKWFGEIKLGVVYVDKDSIEDRTDMWKETIKKAREVENFELEEKAKKALITERGKIYDYWRLTDHTLWGSSTIVGFKVDCVNEIQTIQHITIFNQPMAKGSITQQLRHNTIEKVEPKSVEYAAMKFVCDYARKKYNIK